MSKFLKLCIVSGLLIAGCNTPPQPEIKSGRPNDGPPSPAQSQVAEAPSAAPSGAMPGMPGGGFMTKDPRSIHEVSGYKVVEVKPNDLIASKGSVTLHFKMSDKTEVEPKDKKLQPGETVDITIDQVEDGMIATKVQIK